MIQCISRATWPEIRSQCRPHIPDQHALIPTTTCAPPLGSKKAPVHARSKFRMSFHPADLHTASIAHHSVRSHRSAARLIPRASVVPDTHGHIIASAQQNVAEMWRPAHAADRIAVAGQHDQGPLLWRANVECADDAIHTSRRDHCLSVFVPIVREGLAWWQV